MLGQLTSSPVRLEARFQASDEVLLATIVSVAQTNKTMDKAGKLQAANFTANLVLSKIYKGTVADFHGQVSFIGLDPMGGLPVAAKESYLMFLVRSPLGQLTPANTANSVMQLSLPASQLSGAEGVDGLEADLRASIKAVPGDPREKEWLDILSQFNTSDQATTGLLDGVTKNPDGTIASRALLVLAQSSPQKERYVSPLLKALVKDPSLATQHPQSVYQIVASDTTPNDLADLILLANCSDSGLRLNAVIAIRRMGLHESVGFLVASLGSADRNVQYQAVIALAEINGIYGDYAPSMEVFFKQPAKYTDLWREWAGKNGIHG